ncbi:MAG: hypothetical protein CM15mP84_04330 [Cellvibrionales bacterium]|nr:MAG: hypothetical protein CM15mP84_04330 [Cellvibrionales bacterium]
MARTADEFNSPWHLYGLYRLRVDAMRDGNNLHRCVILKDSADVDRVAALLCAIIKRSRDCGQRF